MFNEHTRRAKRLPLQLPIKVEARADDDIVSNITRLINVSPLGASFYLKQAFQVGRIIQLTIPMPAKLRSYDFLEPQYRVWALVRHCNFTAEGNHIGVAFIGKNPPRSYYENPAQTYRLEDVGGNEFWQIVEEDQRPPERRHPRYEIPISLNLVICDGEDKIVGHERTVTENISVGGAAVFSTLPLKIGDQVKVVTDQFNATLAAEVRNVRMGADGLPRIHLKFTDGTFPLEGIDRV